MSIFYQEVEEPTKKCKCLASVLKHTFAKCHFLRGNLHSTPEPEEPPNDFDQEEEIFVSAIISKYMESKSKRKSSNFGIDSIYWAAAGEIERGENGVENAEEYFSVGSGVSSFDAFVTAKTTCLSRCSSFNAVDFQDFDKRRSLILELIHCQGWPFGLWRKALLLPPLPKSPSDSWLWTKSGRIVKIIGSF